MQSITDLLIQFAHDPRTNALIGLIAVNLITGITKALKLGTFDWQKVAQFYRTNVIPYVAGYAGLYGLVHFGIDLEQTLLREIGNTLSLAPATAALAASIFENIRQIAFTATPTDDIDSDATPHSDGQG